MVVEMLLGVAGVLAYIDPGAGSYLLQILVGGFFGLVLAVKLHWRRLKSFLARRLGRGVDP